MKKNLILTSYLLLLCVTTIPIYAVLSCNSGHKDVTAPVKNSIGIEQNAVDAVTRTNYEPSGMADLSASKIIKRTDAGWRTQTGTDDCSTGWANDSWLLVLTSSYKLTVSAKDQACPGDYFEVYVDDKLIGTTPIPSKWGCGLSGKLSSGCFSINLSPGNHTIKVRNAGFDGHSKVEISGMCPASFFISGTLLKI